MWNPSDNYTRKWQLRPLLDKFDGECTLHCRVILELSLLSLTFKERPNLLDPRTRAHLFLRAYSALVSASRASAARARVCCFAEHRDRV